MLSTTLFPGRYVQGAGGPELEIERSKNLEEINLIILV